MRKRVVSGMRPTGQAAPGASGGRAAELGASCRRNTTAFYFVADWHALTSSYADTGDIVETAIDNVADWIGAGIDPERSTIFVQSMVPEHAELYLLLQMVTPMPWLERVPTYKEQIEQLADSDLSSIGFLGYPLLQTADVIIYNAHFVPVGDDQVPHLELSREVVRRFHNFYGERVRRAAAAADADPAAARARQPQDEQELRQHHRPVGRCGDGEEEDPIDVHGSEARPRRHPGHGRRQPGLHLP